MFLQRVGLLRSQGKSIRAIAAEIGVNRGRVERALKALARVSDGEPLAHLRRSFEAKEMLPSDAEMNVLLVDLGRAQAATQQLHYNLLNVAEQKGVAQLYSQALDLVSPDSYQAGQLLSRLGWVLGLEKIDYHGAQDAFQRALTIARRQGDDISQMRMLVTASLVDLQYLRYREALSRSLQAIEMGRRVHDPLAEAQAHFVAARVLGCTGELARGQLQSSACLAAGERAHDPVWLTSGVWVSHVMCLLKGDWEAARELSVRGLAMSPTDVRLLCTRILLEYQVGDFNEGADYLDQLLESLQLTQSGPAIEHALPAMVLPLLSYYGGEADRIDIAETAAETVLAGPVATPNFIMWARVGLGMVAVLRGDSTMAKEQYLALESQRGSMVSLPVASVDRLLGLLAGITGDLDQAMDHFEDSLAFCRRSGYWPELAWASYDYADALFHRDSSGDRDKAASLLAEGLTTAGALGMSPLQKRGASLQQLVRARSSKATEFPDGLTEREVEVLRLAASGKTDREIAEALLISVMTVNTHIRNILNKANVANRTEATAYAARQGLI
ncbi:MAG: LuxR C-terminal-related transcriptional regulator [Dehalococcoidia bacterium]